MKRILWIPAVLLATLSSPVHGQQGTLLYWWTQAGAEGQWLLRTVYDGGTSCPAPAAVRALPSGAFPVLVCQQTLGGEPVTLPGMARPVAAPGRVERVVVIGDTGCRATEQDCADPASWPFATVASRAAAAGGELTVHVGDYIYRERCSSQVRPPCGDSLQTWVADWFQPVGELLPAAPWVFARGNHEDCTRGGLGWFLFFDPRELPADGCDPTTDPYAVQVSGVGTLLILDSACAPWYSTGCWSTGGSNPVNDSAQAIPAYTGQVAQVARLAEGGGPVWLVTHTPLWARDYPGQADSVGSYILQEAVRRVSPDGELPPNVAVSLVGHIHAWQGLDFAAGRAPVLVLGDGGTAESDGLPPVAPGWSIGGVVVEGFWNNLAFGYTLLESKDAGWGVTLVPVSGTGATCTLADGQIAC